MVPLFYGNPESSNSSIFHNVSKHCFFKSIFIAPRLLGFRSPRLTASGPRADLAKVAKRANRFPLRSHSLSESIPRQSALTFLSDHSVKDCRLQITRPELFALTPCFFEAVKTENVSIRSRERITGPALATMFSLLDG
jgi:hypothetical protein